MNSNYIKSQQTITSTLIPNRLFIGVFLLFLVIFEMHGQINKDTNVLINCEETINIPDLKFEAYLYSKGWDGTGSPSDGKVCANKINLVTYLNIRGLEIKNLKGIEGFTELRLLFCSDNKLTELNLTQNTALYSLECNNNKLTELDLTQNAALYNLQCNNNKIKSLNTSQNAVLAYLGCEYNELSVLDVSKNSELESLYCGKNDINNLNVSINTKLKWLYCHKNKITSLNVSNNINLLRLVCFENNLGSLNVTQNTILKKLDCAKNKIENLNVDRNIMLDWLDCSINSISVLNLEKNTKLRLFYCYENRISNLDLSKSPLLETIFCEENNLTSLNLKNGHNINIEEVNFINNDLNCIIVDDVDYSNRKWKRYTDDGVKFVKTPVECSFKLDLNDGIGVKNPQDQGIIIYYSTEHNGKLHLKKDLDERVKMLIIQDILGKTMYSSYNDSEEYPVSLPDGHYSVKIITNKGVTTKRIIPQR